MQQKERFSTDIFDSCQEVVGSEEIILENDKRIYIDWGRTDEVLGTLLSRYHSNKYPYNLDRCVLPEDPRHMPENLKTGGKEHAMFLWNVCFHMRGWNNSVTAFKQHSQMYTHHPELYDSEYASHLDPLIIKDNLLRYGLGKEVDKIAPAWVDNSRRMQERWQGDPRNIFAGVNTYEEVLKRTKNDMKGGGFWGYQEKITSMAIYYLTEAELVDDFVYPAPTDIHLFRIAIANELVTFDGFEDEENLYSSESLEVMRHLFHEYARQNATNPRDIARAVWLFSRSMCRYQPGNITYKVNGRDDRNGRSTELAAKPIDKNNPAQIKSYDKACGMCPIEEHCKWNVPGKYYNMHGVIIRRGKRIKFPLPEQGVLIDWDNESVEFDINT